VEALEHCFVAMAGPCRLRLYGAPPVLGPAAAAAEREVRRLEAKYSRYRDDSLTSHINRAAGSGQAVPIDDETAGLLRYADTAWRESDGLFDLTSGILRRAWDFKSGRLPATGELEALLPRVGWRKLRWQPTSALLTEPDMEIDFGGCVKEYACDSAAAVLKNAGVDAALVDLAGDMTVFGTPAESDTWQVGIRHPRRQNEAIARIDLRSGALASSGDYERCIQVQGRRYGHILNPKTGWPSEGLLSVSVIAGQCLVAGSTATIAMLKPAEEALTWLDAMGLPWLAVDAALQCHGSIAG
jgi:thiamine biosynthesis lipoprotein